MDTLLGRIDVVTIVKGINVLCKSGTEAIKAAEKRIEEMNLE